MTRRALRSLEADLLVLEACDDLTARERRLVALAKELLEYVPDTSERAARDLERAFRLG